MRLAMALFVVSLLSQPATAGVLHVPADYPTIQQALNAATAGDVVLVAAGTYHEHLLWGGGQAGVKLHSESGAAMTVIDADGTNFGIDVVNAPGTEIAGFTIQNGVRTGFNRGGGITVENSSISITDDVIQNCSAYWGGGIYVDHSSTASILRSTIQHNASVSSAGGIDYEGLPGQIDGNVIANNSSNTAGGLLLATDMVVSNNHFISNVAGSAGGAMIVQNHQVVRGNEFRGNSAQYSGALEASGSAVVDSNTFVGNSAVERAGAIQAYGSAVISRNLFLDNTVQIHGGAIYAAFLGTNPTIRDNVIVRNSSLTHGGGVMIDYFGSATLESNTIVLNQAPTGGGVLVTQTATVVLRNNIVSHSQAGGGVARDASSVVSMTCNDVWGNVGSDYVGMPSKTGSQGNISSDPLYCGLATLDFHLASTSLCALANQPTCGSLIGALDVGCDSPVRTEVTTWGSMKARYR